MHGFIWISNLSRQGKPVKCGRIVPPDDKKVIIPERLRLNACAGLMHRAAATTDAPLPASLPVQRGLTAAIRDAVVTRAIFIACSGGREAAALARAKPAGDLIPGARQSRLGLGTSSCFAARYWRRAGASLSPAGSGRSARHAGTAEA